MIAAVTLLLPNRLDSGGLSTKTRMTISCYNTNRPLIPLSPCTRQSIRVRPEQNHKIKIVLHYECSTYTKEYLHKPYLCGIDIKDSFN